MGLFIAVLMQCVLQTIGAKIEILTDRNTAECGKKLTLTCKIEDYISIVSWMYKDDVIPIANCVEKSCYLNPNYAESFEFTYDMDQGIFNLTILKLTLNDNGIILVCSNGYDSASKFISIREDKALLFEDSENKEITASSSCSFPDTKVMFKWMKIDVIDHKETEFYPQLLLTNIKTCSNDSVCSSNHEIQHLVLISAEPRDDGKYYLKITVVYDNEIIVSKVTTFKYNVEEKDFNNIKGSDVQKIDTTALILIENTFLLIAVACLICLRKKVRNVSCDRCLCLLRSRVRSNNFSNRKVLKDNVVARCLHHYVLQMPCIQTTEEYKPRSQKSTIDEEETEGQMELLKINVNIRKVEKSHFRNKSV